jgi:hypothetical protein
MSSNPNSGKAWSEMDLTDLGQLRSVGIPVDHIAKFLMRDLEDVSEKADSLEAFGFEFTCLHISGTSKNCCGLGSPASLE